MAMAPLPERLERFLRQRRVATIGAMCSAMGRAEITVKQALAKLDYLTSYNENSRFYTLRSLARFDRRGIWRHRRASFARCGTLANLLVALVDGSRSGHTGAELEKITGTSVTVVLAGLARSGRLVRIRSGRQYVHFTGRSKRARAEQVRRRFGSTQPLAEGEEDVTTETLKKTVAVLLEIIRSQPRTQQELWERLRRGHAAIPRRWVGDVCRQHGIRLKKN